MEANREQATRALELGKAAFVAKDYSKALKLFLKSKKLYDSPEATQLAHRAANLLKGEGDPSSSGKSSPSPSSPQKPSNNNNNNSSSSSTSSRSGGGDDHSTWVRRIESARSYYEVLGVTRECSADELKKAYRKTSLRVHPDKNTAQGASNAFQRVTDAYETLSDERKRQIYDQVGHERFEAHVKTGGGAPPPGAGMRAEDIFFGRRGGGGDMGGGVPMEDLFDMLFRAGVRRRGGQGHFQRNPFEAHFAQRGGGRGDGGGGQGGGGSWFSFVPFFLVAFMWLMSMLLSSNPAFSLVRSSVYEVRRSTRVGDEVLDYFVERSFDRRFPRASDVESVERDVRGEWTRVLQHHCQEEMRQRRQQLYWASGKRREELEAKPLEVCDRWKKLTNAAG